MNTMIYILNLRTKNATCSDILRNLQTNNDTICLHFPSNLMDLMEENDKQRTRNVCQLVLRLQKTNIWPEFFSSPESNRRHFESGTHRVLYVVFPAVLQPKPALWLHAPCTLQRHAKPESPVHAVSQQLWAVKTPAERLVDVPSRVIALHIPRRATENDASFIWPQLSRGGKD